MLITEASNKYCPIAKGLCLTKKCMFWAESVTNPEEEGYCDITLSIWVKEAPIILTKVVNKT